MREVVSNEMNLHGEVFTVKVFAVVCEGRRRQLLSMIWWEIEGFLLTVGRAHLVASWLFGAGCVGSTYPYVFRRCRT